MVGSRQLIAWAMAQTRNKKNVNFCCCKNSLCKMGYLLYKCVYTKIS
jgi:hypothetical protein